MRGSGVRIPLAAPQSRDIEYSLRSTRSASLGELLPRGRPPADGLWGGGSPPSSRRRGRRPSTAHIESDASQPRPASHAAGSLAGGDPRQACRMTGAGLAEWPPRARRIASGCGVGMPEQAEDGPSSPRRRPAHRVGVRPLFGEMAATGRRQCAGVQPPGWIGTLPGIDTPHPSWDRGSGFGACAGGWVAAGDGSGWSVDGGPRPGLRWGGMSGPGLGWTRRLRGSATTSSGAARGTTR